jgi:hypothetical protein
MHILLPILLSIGMIFFLLNKRRIRRRIERNIIIFKIEHTDLYVEEIIEFRKRYKELRGSRARLQKALEKFFLKRYKGNKSVSDLVQQDLEKIGASKVIKEAITTVFQTLGLAEMASEATC